MTDPAPTSRPAGGPTGAPDVAFLLPQLCVGGAELSMLRVARGLARHGLAVEMVAAQSSGGPAPLPGEGLPPVVELKARSTLQALPGLVRYLRRTRPRVVVCGQPHLNIVTLAACRVARAGTRTVFVEHAPPRSEIRFQGGWRYHALHVLVPAVYPAADRLVAVSRGVRDELAALVPGSDPLLIHNPVLPDELPRLAAEPAGHPWLGDGGPPVVVGVGRLSPEKDFPTLVGALGLLRRRGRPARLLVLGEGADRGRIEAAAAEQGVADLVSLPGASPNVFAHLSRAAAFASASLFEGFGNVLVEALACGLPVVSTDCPVGPREILEGGRFGRLVPPGDPAALATGLEATLADGRRQPEGAREHAARFSVQASVDRYLALVRSLAPGLASATGRTLPPIDRLAGGSIDRLKFSTLR